MSQLHRRLCPATDQEDSVSEPLSGGTPADIRQFPEELMLFRVIPSTSVEPETEKGLILLGVPGGD